MKMTKKTLKVMAMACIMGAAAFVHGGDIISIDVLDDYPYSMSNGGKKYPNADMPHSIGETVSIRIRLVNNDLGLRAQAYPWEFMSLSSSGSSWLMAPMLGLSVGGVPRYATMVSCLPTRVTTKGSEICFTDLVFEYIVRPGDLAQPLKLLNRDMREAVEGDEYLVVMPSANSHFYNVVDASDSTDVQRDAVFSFCDEMTRTQVIGHYPPADAAADERGTPTEDYTLAGAGVYIKTIDFDSDYVDIAADPYVWRTIAQGSSKSKKNGNPSIVVDAAADFEGSGSATMYVWSENDDIITPVGAKSVDGSTRKALPITISTGDTRKSFVLKATGTEGQGAWIYMSSAPTNMYGTAGELIKNTVSRYVMIGEPEKPSVSVTFRGNSWTEATAKNGYMEADYPVEMAITLSETFDEDVTVTLTPVLKNGPSGSETNIDVYANHVIATAPAAGLGNGWQLATNSVTFTRNEDVEKSLYVYPLGATTGSTRNGGTGIEFQITVEPATANAHFVTKTPGVLYVNPAAPNVTSPVSSQTYEFTAGVSKDVKITVDDSCRNMRYLKDCAETVYAGTNFYTVVWERNDDTSTSTMEWTGLVPDTDGNLALKGVRYPNSGSYLTSQITVTGPEGKQTVIPVSAEVSLPRTVTATPDRADLTYSEGDTVKLTIELSKRDGESLYAFVEPLNEAATNCISGGQVIGANGKASDPGVLVPGTGTAGFKTLDITLLDGYCEPKFQVVLCSEETYDKSKVVDRYTPVPVTIVCENAAPCGKSGRSMNIGGYSVTNNAVLPSSVPADNTISLRFDAFDVAADRRLLPQPNESLIEWVNGNDPAEFTNGLFIVKWAFYNPGGMLVDTRITVGSSRTGRVSTNYVFTAVGDWQVSVQMLDKDMIKALLADGVTREEIVSWEGGVPYGDQNGWWETALPEDEWGPEYRVTVPVAEKANVSVEPLNTTTDADGNVGFKEGQASASFDVKLSVPAELPLKVRLWLERTARTEGVVAGDLGTLGSFVLKDVELGNSTNEYVDVEFGRGVDTVNVRVTYMDGTPYSRYALHAKVVTETPNTQGVKLSDYYIEGATDCQVFNVDPKLDSIQANVGISFNRSTGLASTNAVTLTQNQEVSIGWNVSDEIRMDETNNFTVTWNSSEPGSMSTTNNAVKGTYKTKFSSAGAKTVTLTINDKDGGANFYEWHFTVEASKRLYVYPHGPGVGALSEAVANSYMLADGLGVGTAETSGALGDILQFAQTWDFSVNDNTATIYARGLRAGETDTNKIARASRQGYPTQTGTLAASAADAYRNDVYTNLDSFVYAYIANTVGDNSVFTPTLVKIDPQLDRSQPIQQPVSLPLAEKDAVAYPDRYMEIVFSREWLEADNLGDINADGIPDAFAIKIWRNGRLLPTAMAGSSTSIGADLVDLAAFNDDEDLLPGIYRQGDTLAGVSGSASSYAPLGLPFTARLEIRGFNDGLNARDVGTSDISFGDDELFAWTNLITSAEGIEKGYAATNEEGVVVSSIAPDLSIWSPEPGSPEFLRMDPTMDDTDGDGFPDGWEYFFWYQARVWGPSFQWRDAHPDDLDSNGNKLIDNDAKVARRYPGQPRAGQHFLFERFNLDNIVVGIEITFDEVMERFNPCVKFDPDLAPGAKYLHADFDGDGLSDLEELVIGTNPCHWDTDGDRLCDGWEVMMCLDPLNGSKNDNPDGDFMAYYAVRHGMCWIDPTENVTDPNAEGVRIYVMPNLDNGVDYAMQYDLDTGDRKYVMLRTVEVADAFSFTPKFTGPDGERERVVYGLRDDIPDTISADWIWGGYMVDRVVHETKFTLKAGTEIFDGAFGDKIGYVLVHDQVRDAFGFDPRTAWYRTPNGYVSDRWDPAHNGKNVSLFSQTGKAVNTRPYTNYDEYLLLNYRRWYKIDYSPMTPADGDYDANKETMWSFIRRKTTNPNVVYPVASSTDGSDGETTAATTNETASAAIAKAVAAAFVQAGSDKAPITTHGADTDGDGVPDGWEIYMYRSPNAGPDPRDENPKPSLDHDEDDLSWVEEFAGVDSCNAYSGCESIYKNHPGKTKGWWNKYFPTNPGTMKIGSKTADDGRVLFAGDIYEDGADTDGDGVKDALEGGAWSVVFANAAIRFSDHQVNAKLGFVYGSPEDDGLTVCFRGGGMNPCTIDTDLDGIPDGWEMQHAGVPVQLPGRTLVTPRGGKLEDVALDDATFIADGVFREGFAPSSNIVYIAGGMDATWGGDAAHDEVNDPEAGRSWDDLLGTVRDVDFDHDGLQNYQEYMTQAMRHFRYDDVTTPLMGRIMTEGPYHVMTKTLLAPHTQSFGKAAAGGGDGSGFPVFDPASPENTAANAAEAWYGRSFVYYETVTTGVRNVVKVVNDVTGETSTNSTYFTARRKRFKDGATLVADRVKAGGNGCQQPWTADGWRAAGYFAPPRHSWDRATASGKIFNPLYMYPITEGFMVASDVSVAGYATTDPRIADTDADGMDDYYEMFHGLNPLLGTTPATAANTTWMSGKSGDIISAQFYMKNIEGAGELTLSRFNAWYNEWIYPTFSGLAGRDGMTPSGYDWISAPQAYDPVLYPWAMGSPMVDADGDGVRNDEERILANVADPVARHTDPTPLWFTERTTPSSYVAQYYVMPEDLQYMPWGGRATTTFEAAALNDAADATRDIYNQLSYAFSFEENEGYDTDGDMTPDSIENVKMVRSASDPLRFDDPTRRQALYLDGENSFAMSRDLQLRPADSEDFLKQFTVECWFRPEKTGAAQTIVDRSVAYVGDSINTDKLAIRSNFRLGLTAEGHVYGMFDNNDSIESGLDEPKSCQFVDGGQVKKDEWTHAALTFDGSTLVLYVNGMKSDSAATTLVPANGVIQILQSPDATNSFTSAQYSCAPSAFFVGARPRRGKYAALYPYYIDPVSGEHLESFDNLQDYFQGYVDEVRVWDGARTGSQILANYRKSIGYAEAKENRNDVFQSWYLNNGTRNNNDGNPTLPAELVLNFDFSTLPGAVDPFDVAKVPGGFYANVLSAASSDYATNPDIDTTGFYDNLMELKGSSADGRIEGDLLVGWWNESLIRSTVYDDYHVVPWIKNTVSHLPFADGAAPDSFIYSDNFGAVYTPATDLGVTSFVFPNTANPYSSVVFNQDRYYRVAHARIRRQQLGDAYAADYALTRFQIRNGFTASADLIPMGGAYAKTCPELWDGGVADPWEQTQADTNGDGIPDWWEEYARNNYSPDIDPSASIGWETIVKRPFGGIMVELPAGKAYIIDLYRGMQPDGSVDPDYASNVDADANGIPDWWENLFGVAGHDGDYDSDGDGLSNYAEYMFSFGDAPYGIENGYPLLDPANQRTGAGQKVTDYFIAAPAGGYFTTLEKGVVTNVFENMYLGAIATDHDFMEDWWENLYSRSYANPRQYDPLLDRDGDGWSNWAEVRAYNWQGGFNAQYVDSYLDSNDDGHQDNHPAPAIGVRPTYYGSQDVSGCSLVVRTYSGVSPRIDAKFRATGSNSAGTTGNNLEQTLSIGAYVGDVTIHGFLHPGRIVPGSMNHFYIRRADAEVTFFWHCEGCPFHGTPIGRDPLLNYDYRKYGEWLGNDDFSGTQSQYYAHKAAHTKATLQRTDIDIDEIATTSSTSDAQTGKILSSGAASIQGKEVGTINYATGEYALDLEKVIASGVDLENMMFIARYYYRIGDEWPQTLWMTHPDEGFVKEGLNTIEAFFDINNDGQYTVGEPYGVVEGVDVGWHKTQEIVIELKDTNPVLPRINLADGSSDRAVIEGASAGVSMGGGESSGQSSGESGGESSGAGYGATKTIRIVRNAINGEESRARQVMAHTYVLDDRPYITEADVLSEAADRFDLDWRYLASDARAMGLSPASADYSIVETLSLPGGGVTNTVLGTFTKTFKAVRPIATPVAPVQSEEVYSASPDLSFACNDESATAFRIQIADDTGTNIVYDSGVRILGGRSAESVGEFAHRFTPPVYADAPAVTNGAPLFADGAEYKWRVALFNAAFPANPDFFDEALDSNWSTWADFTMDVGNERINPRIPTGYGKAGAVVRYYGPLTNEAYFASNIVVEAHATADFRSQPLSQARLASADKVRDRDEIDTTTTNAVNAILKGIAPGTVYLMAYIDQNNNGVRDVWESWGYVNFVGTTHEDIYTPKGVTVIDSFTELPREVIYIEDCDVNRNEIPDCLEPESFLTLVVAADDSDRDGLDSAEEADIGTDPGVWDTDGDGMPDGWEYLHSNNVLDPLEPDADLVGEDGDVMAYAEVKACLVTVKNEADPLDGGTVYAILDTSVPVPQVGDKMAGRTLVTTYEYGSKTGVGGEVTIPAGDWRVVAVDKGAKVALVHAQVYDRFGFSSRTCVAGDDAVNTKKMTALDKYLVVRYLEAIGIEPSDEEKAASAVKWDDCFGLEDWVNVNRKWADYTLKAKNKDADLDGVNDGWELYVMFGPSGVGSKTDLDSAAIAPWNYADARTDSPSAEAPGFRVLDEFDGGYWPTDPWNYDTDDDGVFDNYVYLFHLKGDRAGEDADGDGLSNYAEYLVSEVLQIVKLDPNNPMTDGSTLDYYRKFGELYLGEVFSDHDRIDDEWEAQYESGDFDGLTYAARGVYDPDLDLDGDGWSNYAEYRAGTSPKKETDVGIDNYTLIEHPVPVVEMDVSYDGLADIEGATLTVKAWNERRDPDALGAPDAAWTVTTLNETETADQQNEKTGEEPRTKYIGRMPTGKRTYFLGGGAVKEGSFKLCIKDKNYVTGNAVTVGGQNFFQPTGLGDPDAALWYYDVIDQGGTLTTRGGIFAEAHVVGSIDYDTGRVTIDFDDEEFTDELFVGDPSKDAVKSDSGNNSSSSSATKTYHGLHPADSYVMLVWSPVYSMPVCGLHYLSDPATGRLLEGPTTFTVEYTASDTATAGGSDSTSGGGDLHVTTRRMLYGVVRGVDVGWSGAKFKVGLTDASPVTQRMDLRSGEVDRTDYVPYDDIRVSTESNRFEAVTAVGSPVRVRVVRNAINGYQTAATWGDGMADVIYDKLWYGDGRSLLSELDFLEEGMFDIDWTDTFQAKVASATGITRGATDGEAGNVAQVIGAGTSVTNMEYLVVIGDGEANWSRTASTNVVYGFAEKIVRRFDSERARAVPTSSLFTQYSARPTFTWRMDGEEELVKRFGSSYTAFKLQVSDENGSVIYDSGIQRAPAVDADGNFSWTAPICAGAMLASGNVFETAGATYSWRVTMYNAKFRSDAWSAPSEFVMDVNNQQELNDHGYSSIGVAVKYAGPSIVLGKCADMTTAKGKVVVQAFTTPDFTGDPLAAGIATSDVAELAMSEGNAWIKGLPAIGTYYVRAFIDMDGDGKLSKWEPWGYAPDAVTLVNDGTMVKAPVVSIWIDDSDSDRDWLPDAYEYAANDWTGDWDTEVKGKLTPVPMRGGGIDLTIPLASIVNNGAAISRGLPGASLTVLQSAEFVSAILGLSVAETTTIDAINAAVKAKIATNSVKIVSFALEPDGSSVNITVGAEVASGIAGSIVSKLYKFDGAGEVNVKVKVLKKDSLDEATWTEYYTSTDSVTLTSATTGTVKVPLDPTLDLTSGFFRIELIEE